MPVLRENGWTPLPGSWEEVVIPYEAQLSRLLGERKTTKTRSRKVRAEQPTPTVPQTQPPVMQ